MIQLLLFLTKKKELLIKTALFIFLRHLYNDLMQILSKENLASTPRQSREPNDPHKTLIKHDADAV